MDNLRTSITNGPSGMVEVALDGRLDTETAAALEKQLIPLLDGPVLAVRFEMSHLAYISSMGLTLLIRAFKVIKAKDAVLMVVNLQPQIRKVFEIARILGDMRVFTSVEEADEYLDAMQQEALRKDSGQ